MIGWCADIVGFAKYLAKTLLAWRYGWWTVVSVLSRYQSAKLIVACDVTMDLMEVCRKRTVFPHPVGVVIGKDVTLGHDCTIYQNVTIGAKCPLKGGYPTLGDGVTIFAGATIIGPVRIGDGAVIGAGALVFHSVAPGAVVRGGSTGEGRASGQDHDGSRSSP